MTKNDEYDGTRRLQELNKICNICNENYNANTEDQKVCFPCFKKNTSQREIANNEILIDIDDPTEHGSRCVSAIGIGLVKALYHIELWYAAGQKQPHIHIKNIPHMEELSHTQIKEYKKLYLQKYIPKEFWNDKIPDFNLCNINHLIAEENKPHFKYKTIKLLRSEFNIDRPNYCEINLLKQIKFTNDNYKPTIKGSGITSKIIQAINIKDIAKQFGLTLHGNKSLCPFHADGKTQSLVFYEHQGRFHCFGCNADGNIIIFYTMLKEISPDFIYKKSIEVKQ